MVHPSEQILERIETLVPKGIHLARPIGERAKRSGPGAIVGLAPIDAPFDEAGLAQYSQMFRNHRLRHACTTGQSDDRALALTAEALEKSAPRRIRQGLEESVSRELQNTYPFGYGLFIAPWLFVVKGTTVLPDHCKIT